MEDEFGKDYKHKAASGWNKDDHAKNSFFAKSPKPKEKKLSAKKEFSKIDVNGDQSLSKDELRKFVEENDELWSVLGTNLGLNKTTCVRIATEVAFSLAKGEESPQKRKSKPEVSTYELSEAEFKAFYKKYVLSQKGSYDFFLRTIFAFYDLNGDGVLQRDEFDNFLDLFYKSKSTYRQKLNAMPSKQKLKHIAEARLDKNKDGELSFDEIRDLLQVAAVITTDKP
jgi:Ca2+-binding EF-hand superfamily protein